MAFKITCLFLALGVIFSYFGGGVHSLELRKESLPLISPQGLRGPGFNRTNPGVGALGFDRHGPGNLPPAGFRGSPGPGGYGPGNLPPGGFRGSPGPGGYGPGNLPPGGFRGLPGPGGSYPGNLPPGGFRGFPSPGAYSPGNSRPGGFRGFPRPGGYYPGNLRPGGNSPVRYPSPSVNVGPGRPRLPVRTPDIYRIPDQDRQHLNMADQEMEYLPEGAISVTVAAVNETDIGLVYTKVTVFLIPNEKGKEYLQEEPRQGHLNVVKDILRDGGIYALNNILNKKEESGHKIDIGSLINALKNTLKKARKKNK